MVLTDRLVLGRGPVAGAHHPSLDLLLLSAAVAHGPRVVGVVLTGMLTDGAAGLAAVARHGGVAVVQDPHSAEYPSMPAAALAAVPGARTLPLGSLAAEIVRLVSGPPGPAGPDAAAWAADSDTVRAALEPGNGWATAAPSARADPLRRITAP